MLSYLNVFVTLIGCEINLRNSCFDVTYRNGPKFPNRYAWANSADPDQTAPREEQSDQGLHCLPFHLHHLDSLLYGRATQLKF